MVLHNQLNANHWIYGFIAMRMLVDAVIATTISHQTGSWIAGGGFWVLCWVFYLLSFFGTRSGTFHGRYGRKVHRCREPTAWWIVFGVIAVFHAAVTILFAWSVIDWHRLIG